MEEPSGNIKRRGDANSGSRSDGVQRNKLGSIMIRAQLASALPLRTLFLYNLISCVSQGKQGATPSFLFREASSLDFVFDVLGYATPAPQ